MKLTEKANDLVLRRRIIAEMFDSLVPDGVDVAPTIHQSNHKIRCRSKTVMLAGGAIVQDIPELASIAVPVNIRMPPQRRLERRHSIP